MSEIMELPAVAKTVYSLCKKCDSEKAHTVLAHKTATTASIQCTTCKAKKTLNIAPPKKKVSTAGSAAKTKKANEAAELYQKLTKKIGTDEILPYSMSGNFNQDQAIDHPTFGTGFIIKAEASKIEVVFSDSTKLLVQNAK